MPMYRGQILFEHKVWSAGWSEVYYANLPTDANAEAAISSLANARSFLLANGVEVVGWRIGADGGFRETLSRSGLHIGGPTSWGLADTPWQSLLCRLTSGSAHARPLFLRGIPDLVVNPISNEDVTTRDSWYSAVNSYLGLLRSGNVWQIKAEKHDAEGDILNVVSYLSNGDVLTIVTEQDHLLSEGNTVAVYSRRAWSPPPGRRKVVEKVDDKTFAISWHHQTLEAHANVKVRRIVEAFYPITNGNIERVNHRDTGRPFGLPRGRRSARVC